MREAEHRAWRARIRLGSGRWRGGRLGGFDRGGLGSYARGASTLPDCTHGGLTRPYAPSIAGVVRLPEAHPPRPQRLRLGRCRLVGRPVCSVRLVGQDPPSLGPQHGPHDPPLRRPHVGRPLGLVLRRQPPDRVGLARPHHQAVEHARRVQVQHHRGRPQRVGLVRALLAQPDEPGHRLGGLGQGRQGASLSLSLPTCVCVCLCVCSRVPVPSACARALVTPSRTPSPRLARLAPPASDHTHDDLNSCIYLLLQRDYLPP